MIKPDNPNIEFQLGGINHVALVCSDMQKTVDFYSGVLGMPLIKSLDLPGGIGQHFFFDAGNGDCVAFFWFANAADRRFRARHHDVRHVGHHRDRHEACWVVFGVAIKRRPNRQRRGAAEKKRVAVGLGGGGDLAGEGRPGARPVVDIDLLSELIRKCLTDQPAHDIGRPTGREEHNQPNRASWIGLFRPRDRRAGQDSHNEREQQNPAR